MATWSEIEQAEPEFAGRVLARFETGRHKTIATLRVDGSPRISGIEADFVDGELRMGSMPNSRKAADLHRDPRFALHGLTGNPPVGEEASWLPEAKISGRVRPGGDIVDDDGNVQGEWFFADIAEVALTGLNSDATMLRIEWWNVDDGLRSIERA
ncbi:MAG: pyridoxamine 5-phosphate oxidase [Ilumatobacter sp.]